MTLGLRRDIMMDGKKGNEKIIYVHVISLDDYNILCGTYEDLDDTEVLIASETVSYQSNTIVLYNGEELV